MRTWRVGGGVRRGASPRPEAPPVRLPPQGSGFRVQGSGWRVEGSGCRNQGAGFRVQGAGCPPARISGFRVQVLLGFQASGFRSCSDFRVQMFQGSGFRAEGSGCRVQGAGCRVQGAGCRVGGGPAPPASRWSSTSTICFECRI